MQEKSDIDVFCLIVRELRNSPKAMAHIKNFERTSEVR
jgi:hypothetical protein